MRYVIGVDDGHAGDEIAYCLFDTKKHRVVTMEYVKAGEEPRFPWWLRLQMWLGNVQIVRETDTCSPEVIAMLEQNLDTQ